MNTALEVASSRAINRQLDGLRRSAGLDYLFDIGQGSTQQILLIAALTLMATVSVMLGLDKGLRRLSQFNMFAALPIHNFVVDTLYNVHKWKLQFPADHKAIILKDNYIPLEFYNAWISEQIRKTIVETTDWDVLSS